MLRKAATITYFFTFFYSQLSRRLDDKSSRCQKRVVSFQKACKLIIDHRHRSIACPPLLAQFPELVLDDTFLQSLSDILTILGIVVFVSSITVN